MLAAHDHLREKRWYLAAVQAIKSRFFLVIIYRKYLHSLFSSLPLYYAGSPKVPPRVFVPRGPKTLAGQKIAIAQPSGLHSTGFLLKISPHNRAQSTLQNHLWNNERSRDRKLKENGRCTIVTMCRSHAERSTAFYKDLSNIYLKDVNNQRLNQSYRVTRSWYHRTAASIEATDSLASFGLTGSLFTG